MAIAAGDRRLLVVHIDPPKGDLPVERRLFEEAGIDFRAARCQDDDEVAELAGRADGVLCLAYRLSAGVLERCRDVKVVVRYGIGTDNVDVEAATARGIAVCNVPDYCVDEVANHTMAMLLALNRRLVLQDRALRTAGRAALRPMGALRGETLGLIGYGRLGHAVARRAQAFGLRIVAFDPFVGAAADAEVELLPLDELLGVSDYVSVHVPLTPETAGLIGDRELALMKPTAYLVNTARGGVVSEVALAEAIRQGTVAGAGLDVWEHEPVRPGDPLLALDSVVATNHTAFYSDRSLDVLRQRVVGAAVAVLSGRRPAGLVNPSAMESV